MRKAIYDLFTIPRRPPDPVSSHDFEELVWENGTLLMRGRGNRNNDNDLVISSSAYSRFSDNDLAGCEGEGDVREEEAARLGAHNRVFVFAAADTSKPNARVPRPCQTPAPSSFLQPGVDWKHNPPSKNGFSKPSSRSPGGEMNKVNFSHFLGLNYPLVSASKDPGSGAGRTRISPMKVEMDKLEEKPMDSRKYSARLAAETETDAESLKAVSSRFRAGGEDFLVPDEHSQAVGSNFIEDHASQDTSFDDDHQVPSPDSSTEASSSPLPRLKRARFDESESSYLEEDENEEMEDLKRTLNHAKGGTATKRNCPGFHDLAEKERRDQIDKRIRALQELLPNCDKVDKASVLDEAIQYMKTLQLQLQTMLTGNRLFGPPMAMFSGGIHQMLMPYLNPLSPLSTGMGMRMEPCFPQGPAHQFPLHGHNSAVLAGGFQPLGCNPFAPVQEGHPALRPLINGVDFSGAAATMIEQLGSAPPSGSNEWNQGRCFSEVGQKLEL